MTQPNSQQIQALVAQLAGAAAGRATAPAPGMRTVALSLLVDRALSA
ncbi:hypothetical protein LMG28614_01235 [Paraburkholderia ultramafica]|uniref:Uncharacterized protein n=1 Tax=Paraburkholderia ultramafica TaxID=1544867 RepID=A0A6S7B6T6_9BURK|nr:hypothetical protein [Paraburkholderia ultramafica]CAB3781360.1 hypothetical protein LMG28614_01235 [Paraburkholderia ultramafica]